MTACASAELGSEAPKASAPARRALALAADLLRLTKPRITALVVVTGLSGVFLARRTGAVVAIDWRRALVAMVGVALVVSGANALNMVVERDVDARMARTANRPLPARRLSAGLALAFGLCLGFGALPILAVGVNALTACLGGASLVGYVWLYTPLKRVTPWAVAVGAVPGAMPPLLGWTAMTGSLGHAGLALFAVLFFWQLPHFLAIATFRQGEYTGAGIKVLPAVSGERVTRAYASFFSVALVAASLSLVPLGFWRGGPLGAGGWFYLGWALTLGAWFVGASARSTDAVRWSRSLFVSSLVYLPLLLCAMLLS